MKTNSMIAGTPGTAPMTDSKCLRCVTPQKCAVHGCCPGTWAAETPPVTVLPYMGKPKAHYKEGKTAAPYKAPYLTSRGTRRVAALIPPEADDVQ